MNNYNVYSKTKVTPAGYLDFLEVQTVPSAATDMLYEITPAYTHRPDLLANDLYGNKNLWWVFAQRNIDVLKDPVYDFVAGTKIFLPQGQNLIKRLGL